MGQDFQVPSIFDQKGVAKAFQGRVNPYDDNLADGIGSSFPIISIKGKIWAIRHRGERKIVIRPDDGSPSGHLDVVILTQAKGLSKSYYKKYDPGTSEGDRPICASMDGITPDIDVSVKQSDHCALCIRNVWKADADTGRRGRECSDYKRLAVLVMPSQTTPLFGHALLEPMFLRVPPDSLQSLATMGEVMSKKGRHFSTYLTRIHFDPVKAHPSMIFRPVQPLTEQEAEVVLELQNNSVIGRITGAEVTPSGPKLVQQPAMDTAADSMLGLTVPVTKPSPQPDEDKITTGLAGDFAPKVEAPTGRGRPAGSKNKPKQEATMQEVVREAQGNGQSDAGVAEPSDDELDAEIAKLISR